MSRAKSDKPTLSTGGAKLNKNQEFITGALSYIKTGDDEFEDVQGVKFRK